MGVYSFNGNKIISTGGGGIIVTNDEIKARKAKHLTTTAKVDPMRYFHDEIGYNFRLVNILAAIGVAQIENLDKFVFDKIKIANFYKSNLKNVGDIEFQYVNENVFHNNWFFNIKTSKQSQLLNYLNKNKIVSRPFWMPMNQLPMLRIVFIFQKIILR